MKGYFVMAVAGTASVSVVSKCCSELGEGPHWDERIRKLIWVDIFGDSVHVLDPETGKDQEYKLDDNVGAAVPRQKGGSVAVATGRNYVFLDLETGHKEVVATVDDDKKGNRFNDGKCDPVGRFFAGTMGPEPVATQVEPHQGSLYSLNCDKSVTCKFDQVTISNGMAWSPDKKTFYYIDTTARCVDAFDYDLATGALSNRHTVVKVDSSLGWPDGMTIDTEGMLWVAMYNGGKIIRFSPCTGEILSSVEFPVSKVTSCCWAGSNYDELLVTSERVRLSPQEKAAQPLAGSIFRVKNMGTQGLPAVAYNG